VDPPIQKCIDDSASDEVTQARPAGQSSTASDPPPSYTAISPSPPSTPQTPPQMVDYRNRNDPISPENHGGSAETDESQNARLHTGSRETLQHPPSDVDYNRSGSDPVSPENRGGSVGVDEGSNATSRASSRETSQGPPSHTGYDYFGSHTNLQNTPHGGNTSGRDVGNEGSGKLSARKFVFIVAETSIGSYFNRDSDGGDEGASGTLPVSILAAGALHGRRLSSECR